MHVYNEAVTQAFSFPSNAICAIPHKKEMKASICRKPRPSSIFKQVTYYVKTISLPCVSH